MLVLLIKGNRTSPWSMIPQRVLAAWIFFAIFMWLCCTTLGMYSAQVERALFPSREWTSNRLYFRATNAWTAIPPSFCQFIGTVKMPQSFGEPPWESFCRKNGRIEKATKAEYAFRESSESSYSKFSRSGASKPTKRPVVHWIYLMKRASLRWLSVLQAPLLEFQNEIQGVRTSRRLASICFYIE